MEEVPTKLAGTSNCPVPHVPNERNDGRPSNLATLLLAASDREATRPSQANATELQRGSIKSTTNKRKVHKLVREAKGRTDPLLVDSLQKANASLRMYLETCLQQNRQLKLENERNSTQIRSLEMTIERLLGQGQQEKKPAARTTERLLPNLTRLAAASSTTTDPPSSNGLAQLTPHFPLESGQGEARPQYPSQGIDGWTNDTESVRTLLQIQRLEDELQALKRRRRDLTSVQFHSY
jgi:hypothetical protein